MLFDIGAFFMKKQLLTSFAALLAASLALPAAAEKVRPTYTFAGLKYVNQDLDDFNCDQDGLLLDGSYDVDGAIFLRGSFSDVSGDNCGSSSFKLGGGYRVGWGETSHVYGALSFQDISPDQGRGDSGLTMAGGVRGYVAPGIEGYAELEYSTLGDGDLFLSVGSAYWFNGQFSVTGDITVGGDQTTFAIGGRMGF